MPRPNWGLDLLRHDPAFSPLLFQKNTIMFINNSWMDLLNIGFSMLH
jgi:hypothetical protein